MPPEVSKKVQEAIAGAKFDATAIAKIQAGDFSAFTDTIGKVTEKFNKEVIGIVRKRAKIEDQIIKSTQARIAAEKEYVDAQRKAIDIQLEAGKLFSEFGGAKLTTSQKEEARRARFNVGTAGTGINGLQGNDANAINAVSSQISNAFLAQENQAAIGVAGGKAAFTDADSDKRERLKTLQQDLIATTRSEIQARKDELNLIKQKNAAEKSSLEKLLSGDVAGFLQGQATAGAAAALQSGDASLVKLFSASALGAGLKELEKTGENTQQASALALSQVGITDAGSAGVLSGDTPEEQRLKQEGRDLSATLGGLAQQSADFERAEITTKQAIINAQKVELSQVGSDRANAGRVRGLAGGGTVYASQGMFIPRGTDTVPAMLTPGEFVVNRSAVQRGNNMQILRAMNSGSGSAASGPGRMSGGGQVRYMNAGGIVDAISGVFSKALPNLQTVFTDFSNAVNNLLSSTLTVKVDTTNVNVNFNGGSFLTNLRDDIRDSLLAEVETEIKQYRVNQSGDLQKRDGIT